MVRPWSNLWGAVCWVLLIGGCHAEFHASTGGAAEEEEAAGGEADAAEPAEEEAPAAEEAAAEEAPVEEAAAEEQPADASAVEAVETGEPQEDDGGGDTAPTLGKVELVCQFSDAWVAVVPRRIYRPNDEFLMQALIGFTEEPAFWSGQAEWSRYANFPAVRCGVDPLRRDLRPGSWVILVGWAGRFEEAGAYTDNGRIERITVRPGETITRTFTTGMLNHDWSCISCPYLVVPRDGRTVEVGQVLLDRYSARREGTDVRSVDVDVRDGRLTVTLVEREPEVSHVDAVEVVVGGRALPLAAGTPPALSRVDGIRHSFTMGESVDVVFDASDIADGTVAAEIRVTGYYEPVGPLL